MNTETKQEWDKGWKDGYNKAISIKRKFKIEDFPEDFGHRNGSYWSGYGEGVISAEGKKSYN